MLVSSGVASGSRSLASAIFILVTSGAVTAATTGATVAAVGALFSPLENEVVLLAMGALLLGGVFVQTRPWQVDQETQTEWLAYGDWRTVALNGAVLGVGFGTRIGYWAWYVIPLAAFASRDPLIGASLFSTYAITRLVLSASVVPKLPDSWLVGRSRTVSKVLDPIACLVLVALAL